MTGGEREERVPYTFPAYARDHTFSLAMALVFLGLMDLTVIPFIANWKLAVFLDGLFAVCMGAAFFYGYRRQRKFFAEAMEASGSDVDPEQLDDLLPEAPSLDAKVARGAMLRVAKSSEDERTRLRMESKARKEYTELWVHEVKTPIAASMLILNDMHDENASKLKREMERISSCVDQSLYYARSESLSTDYFIRELSLAEMIGEACKANMRALTHRDIVIQMEIPPDLTVLADRTWTEFMISQIISNSAKYGAAHIRFTAVEEGEGTGGRTILEIADDGCGIPAEDVPRVFDHGFTGSVGRSHGSATGMGLYLVASLCRRMGLGAELASEEGAGTRVLISFPHDRRRFEFSA